MYGASLEAWERVCGSFQMKEDYNVAVFAVIRKYVHNGLLLLLRWKESELWQFINYFMLLLLLLLSYIYIYIYLFFILVFSSCNSLLIKFCQFFNFFLAWTMPSLPI